MLSSSSLLFLLLLSLLIKNLVTSEEIPIQDGTQSAILNFPKLNHEETHREMRDHLLPKIRRMSQRMQSIILSTTKEFDKMQKYQDVTKQYCLPSSLILYIAQLSTNLTRIVQTEVPFIQQELQRIVLDMDKLQNEINQFTHDDKQQKVVRLNEEQLQTFHKLTSAYRKLNDETLELNRKLMQMINETLRPGLGPVDEYNECMKSTAHALIDYSLDQLIEHMDDDENEPLLSTDILLPHNHTDL